MEERPRLRLVPDPPAETDPAPGAVLVDPGLAALGEEVADIREAVFALGDLARRALPLDRDGVHVSLQVAAHQLGEVERMLSASGRAVGA